MFFALGYIVGFATAFAGFAIYHNWNKRNDKFAEKRARLSEEDVLKEVEMMGSIKYRFSKVNEITEAQLDLISRAERPSASALHSRSKNDLANQIKALEEEKMEIFRSILKDGFDPTLQIVIDGVLQNIKMSEAVAMHEGNSPYPDKNTDQIKPRKNRLRLVTQNEEVNAQSNHSEVPSPRS